MQEISCATQKATLKVKGRFKQSCEMLLLKLCLQVSTVAPFSFLVVANNLENSPIFSNTPRRSPC